LDLSRLRNAIISCDKEINLHEELVEGVAAGDLRKMSRSALIRTFEITRELCRITMQRCPEMNLDPGVAIGINRREFYRIRAENLMIDDVNRRMAFQNAGNSPLRAYDETAAEEVFAVALDFLPRARDILKRLEE
jgi:hypothetical protein